MWWFVEPQFRSHTQTLCLIIIQLFDTRLLCWGRDHAIRPYNDYRALCNLKRASSFEDLSREIPPEVIARLKRIYATVDDIDLFPGGMSERPLQGGLVGPTFGCIIGIQFRQLRKCDRFWWVASDIHCKDAAMSFTGSETAKQGKKDWYVDIPVIDTISWNL
jgi:hypothetical protein